MTGMSITVWAVDFHYENLEKNTKSQKELKNNGQVTNAKPSALDHNNIILVLVCTGLIGFFGLRRQRKTLEKFVKVKHSECRPHVNSLNENNHERQACRGKLNIPDKCF
jgi:hypothetical protein